MVERTHLSGILLTDDAIEVTAHRHEDGRSVVVEIVTNREDRQSPPIQVFLNGALVAGGWFDAANPDDAQEVTGDGATADG